MLIIKNVILIVNFFFEIYFSCLFRGKGNINIMYCYE